MRSDFADYPVPNPFSPLDIPFFRPEFFPRRRMKDERREPMFISGVLAAPPRSYVPSLHYQPVFSFPSPPPPSTSSIVSPIKLEPGSSPPRTP